MDQELYKTEQIDKYINGEMKEEELNQFEEEIKADNELDKRVQIRRDLLLGIQLFGNNSLENVLYQIENQLDQEGFFLNEEHIRQFLSGDLSPSLVDRFNDRLAKDEAFSKEVAFQKDLLKGISKFGNETEESKILDIKAKLEKEGFFETEEKQEAQKANITQNPTARIIPMMHSRRLAIAASVLLLIAASVFYLIRPNQYDQLFANYFQPEQTKFALIIDDLDSPGMGTPDKQRRDQLLEAFLFYESGDYHQARQLLQNHLTNFPDDTDAKFYFGITLLQTGDSNKAMHLYMDLLNNPSDWEKEAKWYLALSQLKVKKEWENAIRLFHEIAEDEDSPYQDKANTLIANLEL